MLLAGCAAAHADQSSDGAAVLQKYCARCHTGAKAEAELSFVTDTKRLIAEGLVVPGDASRSLVFRRVEAGEMPPEQVKARPTPAEVAALRIWIDGMTTRPAQGDSIAFRRDRDVSRLLAADEARVSFEARPFTRWFTITHLANAGLPEEQLEGYRNALTVLLASLTWSPAPAVPIAVDPERTIFRIDLRELGWTAATWDAIRASYPYGLARGANVPDSIRADWFVATASRPPLYHTILAMPDTEPDLARRLGVDLNYDIANGRVARAGFNRSGISVNNRVIERHTTRHGALWRSYDFASSIGRENVFTQPLAFVPAGGEIIFNLPDGLQAYMLVDRNGKRIDKAPATIVSDPNRPDRAVETAISCIGCHASGIIPHADQIRETAGAFDEFDRDRIRQLHPSADALGALFAQDRARFARALGAIGVSPAADSINEPVSLLTRRYEADLDLKSAAAELGLRPEELEGRLVRSTSLRQTFGSLANKGGTVKRDNWATLFPRAVQELGIGFAFTPRASHDLSPAVWIDRDHSTWILVAASSDQATALTQCRSRTLELPRTDELANAVGNGLTAALQINHPLWSAGIKLDSSNQRYAAIVDPLTGAVRRADVADRHGVVCVQR